MIYEEQALEMVHLMLETDGVHSFQITLERLAGGVLSAHP
jgi:hypothetical protein